MPERSKTHRDALCQWAREHGIDPANLTAEGGWRIEGETIVWRVAQRDPVGALQYVRGPGGEPILALVETRTPLLRPEPTEDTCR